MDIRIYGKRDCSYCTKAKELLADLGVTGQYVNVDQPGFDKANLVTNIAPGAKTVPVVIFNGEYIGGYTELAKLMQTWKNEIGRLATELQNRVWLVKFKKIDGSIREMRCTTNMGMIPLRDRPAAEPKYEGTLIFKDVDPNEGKKIGQWQFNVYETDRSQWRSFVADRVISVRPA